MPQFTTPEDVQDTQAQIFPADFNTNQAPVSPAYVQRKALITGIATASPDINPQTLSDHVDKTSNLLDMGEEQQINTNLAYDQKSKDRTTQQDVLKDSIINNDPITFQDVAQAYTSPTPPTDYEINTASEKETFTKLQDYAAHEDSVQAKVQEQLPPEVLAAQNDQQVKRETIYQDLLKQQTIIDDKPWMENLKDFLGFAAVPLQFENTLTGNQPVKRTAPKLMTGSQIQAETNNLLATPADKFPAAYQKYKDNLDNTLTIIGTNDYAKKIALQNLLDYNNNQASLDNISSIFDHATFGLGAGRMLRSLSRMMVTAGSRVGSAELNATKILYGSTFDGTATVEPRKASPIGRFITQQDAFTDMSHSAMTPDITQLVGTNAPTAVYKAIDKMEATADRINSLQRSPFLYPAERATAIKRTTKEVSDRITPQGLSVADFHMVSQPNSATTQIGIKIGKADGTGWSTPENAMAAIERSGYGVGDFTTARGIDGQHYPILKTTVSGNGLTVPANIDKLDGGAGLGMIRKYTQNADITDLPRLRILRNEGDYNTGYLITKVFKPLLRPASELSGKSQNILAKVMNVNMDLGRDLSATEFTSEWKRISGSNPTNKEMTAYYSLKQTNNVNFALDNRAIVEDKDINGFKDFQFTSTEKLPARLEARPVDNLPLKGSTRIYNATKDEVSKIDSLRPTDIAKMKEEGYNLFQVSENLDLEGGPITHILSKSDDFIQHELSPFQLDYKQGNAGPRVYAKGYYVKQVQTHEFDDGTKYRGRDLTLFHGRTKTELQSYVTDFNKALTAFKDYKAGKINIVEAEGVLGKHTDYETVDQFQKAIDDGLFTDHPMQVVRDGERPKFGSTVINGELHHPEDLSDFTIHAYQQGRLVRSPRGERLMTPSGQKAQVLDVYSSVSKAASTASRHAAFDVYKKTAIDIWYNTAKDLEVLKDPMASGAANLFDKDPYLSTIDPDIKSKLETMRMPILRVLGQKTKSQEAFTASVEHIGNWIENKPYGTKIAPRLYDIMDGNPLAALRGLTFHKSLGFFNPAQLIVQPSTMAMALAAHPVYGVQSVFALPFVRLATINGNATVLDYLAKTMEAKSLGHGMTAKQFKTYIKELQASGIADSSAQLAIRDYGHDVAISQSKANLGVKDMAEASTFFFNEGNKINQLVAHGIAYRKAMKEFPESQLSSPEARAFIKDETSKLAVSMKSSSSAFWQKGVASYPLQFQGYTERMLDIMAPAFLGGDKRFTPAQKMRILAGQGILFGKYGIPAAGLASAISYAFGIDEDKAKEFEGGVMDKTASDIFGTEVSYSQRVGITENIRQLVSNLTDSGFADVAGGPTYTGTSNWIKQLQSATKMVTANSLEDEKITTFDRYSAIMGVAEKTVINNIASLSNAQKAMFLYNYGKLMTNTGSEVTNESEVGTELVHNHLAALAVMLSIPLKNAVTANELYRSNSDSKDYEDSIVKQIGQFQQEYSNAAGEGNDVLAQEKSDQVQLMLLLLPENRQQRQNAMGRVNDKPNNDTLLQYNKKQQKKLQGDE